MRAFLEKTVIGLLLAGALLYAGDWIVFQVKAARGSGTSSVQVESYLATPLKGNKVEYDYIGQVDQPCVRAIFPHAAQPACWWVRRHKEHWE